MQDGFLKDMLEGKRYPTDLIIVVFWSVLATIGVLFLPEGNIFRLLLGIPLVIFIPGYALVSVLWPERSRKIIIDDTQKGINDTHDDHINKGMDNIERIAMSFGLSIVLIALIGLCLNYVWEISLLPISQSLFVFVLMSSYLAWFRRNKLPKTERFSISLSYMLKPQSVEHGLADKAVVIVLVVSLIIAGSALLYVILTSNDSGSYSEFYILDLGRSHDDLPTDLHVNETRTVIIGIVCHENEYTSYSIVTSLENSTQTIQYHNWSQTYKLTTNYSIGHDVSLEHLGTYERQFNFYFDEIGKYKVTWRLYIDDVETDYDVHLWVNVI